MIHMSLFWCWSGEGSTCFNLYDCSLSVDFSFLTGRGTVDETNCNFMMTSFFFMVMSVLEILVTGI